jgi:hypothetical protein
MTHDRPAHPEYSGRAGLRDRAGSIDPYWACDWYTPLAASSSCVSGRGDRGREICDRKDSDAANVRAWRSESAWRLQHVTSHSAI